MALNKCSECGAVYKEGAKFCLSCGKEFEVNVMNDSKGSVKSNQKTKKLPITIVSLIAAAAIAVFGISRVPAVNEKTNDKK